MACGCQASNQTLGDAATDAVIQNVLDTARGIWPERTAEFETWVNAQLQSYGISYVKYQAAQNANAFISNPLIWLAGAVVVAKIL